MFALLILNGRVGAPSTSILAVTYDPPASVPPRPSQDMLALAEIARINLAMHRQLALPFTHKEPR